MRKLIIFCAALIFTSAAMAVTPKTDDEKILYVLGQILARNIAPFDLTKDEFKFVQAGFGDGVGGEKSQVELEKFGPKLNEWVQKRMTVIATAEKKKGADFIAKIAKEPGVKKHASGFYYKIEKEGKGAKPKASDKVKVHYHGTLIDGKVFDSSVERKEPATFNLDHVIPCWTQGVQELTVGGKMKLYCPSEVAYGDRGQPPHIKGGATLIFEIELLSIEKEQPKVEIPKALPTPKKSDAKD